jgi:hypothetical protein
LKRLIGLCGSRDTYDAVDRTVCGISTILANVLVCTRLCSQRGPTMTFAGS